MQIEDKILEILSKNKPLKAKEIVDILIGIHGHQVDKSAVNSILYRKLNGKVEQNKSYQWTIKKDKKQESKVTVINASKQGTPLSSLAMYYLECIAKDMDGGISVFTTNKYNLEYNQLKRFPSGENADQSISSYLVEKVRKDKNNLVFKFGYPINIRSIKGKDNNTYYFAEPVFLFTIDNDYSLLSGRIKLTDDDPILNPKAISSITGINSDSEMLLEIVELYEELGINNDPEDKPSMEDLFERLHNIRSEWKWKELPDISSLSVQDISLINETGIFNAAAVFIGEKSKYTIGLEKDLKDLSGISESQYNNSALGSWISNKIGGSSTNNNLLIEPIPMNEEQRDAVHRALTSPLTVVTGPPGTGKSQVVANIVVNAVYQGQTVLFTSKNNKAVDVVNDRVNALSNRQVMLRLGAKFQTTLSEYLSGLLSSRPTNDDQARFKETNEIHSHLSSELKKIHSQQEQVLILRNIIDQEEQRLEKIRAEFGSDFFSSCEFLTQDEMEGASAVLESTLAKLHRADREKQTLFTKVFWRFAKTERINSLRESLNVVYNSLSILKISKPQVIIDEDSIQIISQFLDRCFQKLEYAKQINKYFVSLSKLSSTNDLFKLSQVEKKLSEESVGNSAELWSNWLQLLPNKLTQEDRKTIGDYIAILNLIVASENSKQPLDRDIWPKYYSFLPKVMHILPCWSVTSLSARGRIPLGPGFFDLVVIDEASQCDIASAIPLLYRAKRAVIIGDDKQLTHISAISENQDIHLLKKYRLDEKFMGWSYAATSIFRLASSLCKPEDIVVLRNHHRSHADIINYSNKYFYEGNLRVATKYENLKSVPNSPTVRWIDVKGRCERPETGSSFNDIEASEVVAELSRLVKAGYTGTIGVVTPFRAQFLKILDRVNNDKDLYDRLLIRDFLCDTVHKFQGDERDVIIFSPVVSHLISDGAIGFLKRSGNLFNVAITRARAALIVIGDKQNCFSSGISHYQGFIEYIGGLSNALNTSASHTKEDFGPKYPKVNLSVAVSDWERYFYEELHKAGIITTPQLEVGQYFLDLALFEGNRKLNIEIDGDRYHRNWDGELLKRDQIRNKRLIELGWDVKRFWIYQIRDNTKQCIKLIQDWKSDSNFPN